MTLFHICVAGVFSGIVPAGIVCPARLPFFAERGRRDHGNHP